MIYNFSSGPAMLPTEVMEQIKQEWFNWNNTGLSVVEWSHRDRKFEPMIHQTKDLLRSLMNIPKDYEVLFMQGGASLVWSTLPMNIAWGGKAGYVTSGVWSEKAIKEAGKYLDVTTVASSETTEGYFNYPKTDSWQMSADLAYVHYCSNETIQGIQFSDTPDINLPLVCDMSSDILSKPIDVKKFGLIYAGTQKNIGVAGLTILIIRKDWLDINHKNTNLIPNTLNYKNVADSLSLLNTPSTFAIYACNLVLQWLKKQGGAIGIAKINNEKAALFYDYLDKSDFYLTNISKSARSLMNVTFKLRDEGLQNKFLQESDSAGLKQLKGHRAIGGLRASIYNPMPIAGVETLVNFLEDFAQKNK